jgi:regulator of sigma E protease
MLEILTSAPYYVFGFLVLLTVVVFIHELGHFSVARACGVRVEVFSIGFGSELFGWTDRHGTRWKISALPLGGYVKMFGQGEHVVDQAGSERAMTEAEKKVAFSQKRIWQRAAIVSAGPLANLALTVVAFAILFATIGQPYPPAVVGEVTPGSAAEQAGLKAGDRILSVNGVAVQYFSDFFVKVRESNGAPLAIVLQRGDQQLSLSAQPTLVRDAESGEPARGHYQLGVRAGSIEYLPPVDPVTAAADAVTQTFNGSVGLLVYVGQWISGHSSGEEVGGVTRIVKIAGDAAKKSYKDFLYLIPALSLNLGLLNLFPIPLLDGGHLAFYAIEAVRGRPLGDRAQEWGMRIGIALVLGLMVFATWNDLVYLKVVDFIKNLVT